MGIARSSNLRGIVLSITLLSLAPSSSLARKLLFSEGVTTKQADQIKADLKYKISLANDIPTEKVMGIKNLKNSSLKSWLSARVGYVVGTSDIEDVSPIQNYEYPDNLFPDFEKPEKFLSATESIPSAPTESVDFVTYPNTVMTNVGTSYYYTGKSLNVLAGYRFKTTKDEQIIPILSPRVGILRVGDGLFRVPFPDKPKSIVNTWYRLITLFHEAHHSDGNGKSLGFPHALCPEGHDYYNYDACDREINGAYGVEAFLLRRVMLDCVAKNTCDAKEAEYLARMVNDAVSRILNMDIYMDAQPEEIVVAKGSIGH